MGINKNLFDECTSNLIDIIDSSNLNEKEKRYRKKILNETYSNMIKNEVIDNKYYALSHEIKSLKLLSSLKNCTITNDHNGKPGCDFKINDNYNIECVSCTPGDEEKNGYDKFYGSGVFDYNKKENIILTRILQALDKKKEFYYEHLGKSIKEDDPYIVFLSLGSLSYGSFFGKYGLFFNKILVGLHHQVFLYDRAQQRFTGTAYQYRDQIINHNNSPISCRYYNEENSFVSAIIFTTAVLDKDYNIDNTYIFLNPFAKNKVKVSQLPNLVYWKEDKYGNYIPRYKGKNLNSKIKTSVM